jgi:hypothetical protein
VGREAHRRALRRRFQERFHPAIRSARQLLLPRSADATVKAVFPYVAGRIPGSPFRLRSAECRGLDEKPGTFTYSRLSCEIVSYDGQARGTIAVRPTSPTTFRWTRRENRDREWEQEQAVVHPRERGGEEGADQRHRPKLDHASGLACSILVRMRMSGRERRSKTLGSEALRS